VCVYRDISYEDNGFSTTDSIYNFPDSDHCQRRWLFSIVFPWCWQWHWMCLQQRIVSDKVVDQVRQRHYCILEDQCLYDLQ